MVFYCLVIVLLLDLKWDEKQFFVRLDYNSLSNMYICKSFESKSSHLIDSFSVSFKQKVKRFSNYGKFAQSSIYRVKQH